MELKLSFYIMFHTAWDGAIRQILPDRSTARLSQGDHHGKVYENFGPENLASREENM